MVITMDITPAKLNVMPKDTPIKGIPTLPFDNQESALPTDLPLAMVTIRNQCFKDLYLPEQGLKAGTIFKEFELPFYGTGGTLL